MTAKMCTYRGNSVFIICCVKQSVFRVQFSAFKIKTKHRGVDDRLPLTLKTTIDEVLRPLHLLRSYFLDYIQILRSPGIKKKKKKKESYWSCRLTLTLQAWIFLWTRVEIWTDGIVDCVLLTCRGCIPEAMRSLIILTWARAFGSAGRRRGPGLVSSMYWITASYINKRILVTFF